MLATRYTTVSALVAALLLPGCTNNPAVLLPAASCPANTICSSTGVTVSIPVNVATGAGQATTATGMASLLGATTVTMPLDPSGNPVSATFSGAVNTSVTLTQQPFTAPNPGSFTGIAANGQSVILNSFNKPNVAAGLNGVNLTYADFGEWIMQPTASGPGTATYSVWAGGTQLTGTMPTSGSATYAGMTRGISQAGNTIYQLNGNVTLTADFVAGTVTGGITGITAATFQNQGIPGTPGTTTLAGNFNDVALNGTISGNSFNGTATAQVLTTPGPNPAAIAAGTTGTVNGQFYGPTANEVTGVWALSTPTVQAMGSFGAK